MAASLSVVVALLAALTFVQGASAADDEPDLLPFLGSFAVGCTWDNGCSGGHHGAATPAVDFPMPEGTAVLAAGTGVAHLYEDDCAGKYIEVWHAGVRKYSRYLHLSAYAIHDGDTVQRGQIIARSGNTGAIGGCSTGAHLHYDELNASHSRIDPGPMVGWSGSAWVTYPAAAGAAGWGAVTAFYGPAMTNGFTITSGTPTTMLSTTTATTGPRVTVTVPPTQPTVPPPTPTATTTPRANALPEGTLFRAADAPNIYIYAAGSPWWIPDPTQLELLGGWGQVQVAGPSLDALLTAMPWQALQYQAFVEAGNGTMYWCAGGSPWPISSMAELAALQALTGSTGWHRLPGAAGATQWACGGTRPGTVFQHRGATDYWVWTINGWAHYDEPTSLAGDGWGNQPINLLPS